MEDLKYTLYKLGYRWFELEDNLDLAGLVIKILQSKDLRLVKAVPFIIYQSQKNNQTFFDWGKLWQLSNKHNLKNETVFLIYLSQQIYSKEKLFDLVLELETHLNNNLTSKERGVLHNNPDSFLKKLSFKISQFKSFFEETYREFITSLKLEKLEKQEYLQEEISKSKELELKFALSFLFKKKQREIIQKILQEKALTKTEYEYYIRIIKKRLEALVQIKELAEAVLRKKAQKVSK